MYNICLPELRRLLGTGAVAVITFLQTTAATAQEDNSFQSLLTESKMVMQCEEGYRNIEVQYNELLQHEKALRTEDDKIEIRFAIRPISRIQIDYQDPHSAAPEPEHIFPMLFQSLLERFAGSGHSPHREYLPAQARELFNADWAAAAVFDLRPEMQSEFEQGLLVAIHGGGRADAYSIILFDDYETAKTGVNQALRCLAFFPQN